ncbi:PIG-L family deacetylase [Leptospira ilyithenensis]|uniref:PIG-L family deacetylase n=1 Tax=Leptospira ilyithenensis TaxID=2484901 RepID=A0A4R9LT42_9LEPT|nr:PIG-L family deacetylase [Leptospira ilyithenensis]TGN14676.1 PIG-L family deacetylase [Leptospira ilyithenensis]
MKVLKIILSSLLVLISLVLATAYFFVRSLFQEPSAAEVTSLNESLKSKRILGVFAHPDDEQLVNSVFVRAKKSDPNAFTALVTATKGEAGHQVPVVARQKDLGFIRKAEALKNGYAMGIDEQEVWDYPDGGIPEVPIEELKEKIRQTIETYHPEILLTFWPESGATGHKDHRRMGLAASEVAKGFKSQNKGTYFGPRYIAYVITPRDAFRTLGGEIGKFVAENQPAPTHSLRSETESKLKGWEIHASQGDYVREAYGIPARVLYMIWDKEYYYVVDLEKK